MSAKRDEKVFQTKFSTFQQCHRCFDDPCTTYQWTAYGGRKSTNLSKRANETAARIHKNKLHFSLHRARSVVTRVRFCLYYSPATVRNLSGGGEGVVRRTTSVGNLGMFDGGDREKFSGVATQMVYEILKLAKNSCTISNRVRSTPCIGGAKLSRKALGLCWKHNCPERMLVSGKNFNGKTF